MRNFGVSVRVIVFAGLMAACQSGQSSSGLSDVDRGAVQKLAVDDAVSALAARDFAAFANTYSQDAAYLPPNAAAVRGRDAILKFLNGFPPYTDFKASAVTIDGSGDVAYVQGTYSMMITLPGAAGPTHDEGKWVVTARKQADGSWKSTTGIWNSDLPVAAPPAPAKP